MKFLADMGISQTTVKWLNKQGRDAIHVRDVGMYRSLDAEILSKAKVEDGLKRIFGLENRVT